MIRSGDRIPTGTGANRRRLTRDEAEAGGLPEPMTAEEWEAMYHASRLLHNGYAYRASHDLVEVHPNELGTHT